jgi:hypothetical protein
VTLPPLRVPDRRDSSPNAAKKVRGRVTIKELSPTSYTFKIEFQGPDGTWTPAVETRSTKVK